MAFNNLGRELYERTLDTAGKNILLKKKKNAVKLLKDNPEGFLTELSAIAYRCGRPHKFEALKQALHWVEDYSKTTHYFVEINDNTTLGEVSNLLTDFNSEKILELGKEYTVEVNFDYGTLLLNFTQFEDGYLNINGHNIVGALDVFASIDRSITESFTAPLTTPITTVYLGENNRLLLAYVPGGLLSYGTKHKTAKAVLEGETYNMELISGKPDDAYVSLLSAGLIGIFQILSVKNTVKIRNSKRNKASENSSAPVKADQACAHVIYEDKVVPLQRYITEHASEYVYKGGHHASPVPHERRGFYRRSNGRGDYNFVNGDYIYVGGKQGKYSWVPSTHVGGKNDTVIIYKA